MIFNKAFQSALLLSQSEFALCDSIELDQPFRRFLVGCRLPNDLRYDFDTFCSMFLKKRTLEEGYDMHRADSCSCILSEDLLSYSPQDDSSVHELLNETLRLLYKDLLPKEDHPIEADELCKELDETQKNLVQAEGHPIEVGERLSKLNETQRKQLAYGLIQRLKHLYYKAENISGFTAESILKLKSLLLPFTCINEIDLEPYLSFNHHEFVRLCCLYIEKHPESSVVLYRLIAILMVSYYGQPIYNSQKNCKSLGLVVSQRKPMPAFNFILSYADGTCQEGTFEQNDYLDIRNPQSKTSTDLIALLNQIYSEYKSVYSEDWENKLNEEMFAYSKAKYLSEKEYREFYEQEISSARERWTIQPIACYKALVAEHCHNDLRSFNHEMVKELIELLRQNGSQVQDSLYEEMFRITYLKEHINSRKSKGDDEQLKQPLPILPSNLNLAQAKAIYSFLSDGGYLARTTIETFLLHFGFGNNEPAESIYWNRDLTSLGVLIDAIGGNYKVFSEHVKLCSGKILKVASLRNQHNSNKGNDQYVKLSQNIKNILKML